MTILWKWNETDTTEFGDPIIVLGQLTGTLALERIPAFQTSSVFEPTLRLNYGRFHISGGLIGALYSASALIPIAVGVDLPKRYSICLNTWHMSGAANMTYGFVFGACSGANGVFGTAITRRIRQAAEDLRVRAFNGTDKMSEEFNAVSYEVLNSVSNSVTSHKITVDLSSLTASSSGTAWKLSSRSFYDPRGSAFSKVYNVSTKLGYVAGNPYGNWTGESNLTKLYLVVQNPVTSSVNAATLNMSNLCIERHPADEV